MALKTFKPYTKSTRGTVLVDRTGLWKGKPFKMLVEPKNSMRGRNNNGHITSRNMSGGGHKKMYRLVDFYRKKFDVPGTVERIEYDPNRSCYIMLILITFTLKIFSIFFFKLVLLASLATLNTILFCSERFVVFSVTIGDKILSYKCILSILRISLF